MPENQTVWKSDNQGVQEETFIQTGRREGQIWAARAERMHSKAVAGGPGRAETDRIGGPTLCADKPGGTTGEQDRPHNPGSQRRNKASSL